MNESANKHRQRHGLGGWIALQGFSYIDLMLWMNIAADKTDTPKASYMLRLFVLLLNFFFNLL